MDEPFFSSLSRSIDKTATRSLPTAAVRFNKENVQFELLYNPEFMGSLTEKQRKAVLLHEFYHIVFEHVQGTRISEDAWKKDAQRWNIAADLAINSHLLDSLPEFCCLPGQGQFSDMPVGKATEWYFKSLPADVGREDGNGDGSGDPGDCPSCDGSGKGEDGEECPDCKGSGKASGKGGEGQFDSHDFWGDMTEEEKAMAKARAGEILQGASNEANSRGWGTVGADTKKRIMDMLSSMVNWRSVLRYCIKASMKADKRSTVRRINRKYPRIHPGSKVTRQARIAIAIDQSGSVGDKLLAQFFTELDSLAKLATFTVIPFDTRVDEKLVYVWKKGERKVWDRCMAGGTCFDAPTSYVNEKGTFDLLVILTDLEAPAPKACRCQRIWLAPIDSCKNPPFATTERVVPVPIDNPWC